MPTVSFGLAAEAEIIEATNWYRSHAEALSDRFRAQLEATVERIAENPLQFPAISGELRRARVRHFPYALFFRIDEQAVTVVACFHGRRDPRRWRGRS